ncbi:MAG: hypothetical protein WBA44_05135 [Mesorhizobium sp.]
MRNDAYSNVAAVPALAPAVQSAAANGASIDRKGYGGLLFVLNTGAVVGDGDFGAKVQESANNTDWTDADAEDVLGAFPATLAANSAYRASYIGKQRYARLATTKAGGTSIAAGAVAVLTLPHIAPVA